MTLPFRPDPFLSKFERLRALRQRPLVGYAVAVASVAAASVVRVGFSDLLVGVRFAPYYIAVALTAAVGGGGPGLLAMGLSVLTANYLMTPITPTTPTAAVASGLFLVIAGTMVTLVWLLNHAIDRIWHQAENTRFILESQTAGLIGVDEEGRITLVNSAVERQLGYSRDEMLGLQIDQLVPMEARGRHARLRGSYLEHPESRMMGAGRDLSAVTKDGSLLPVEIGLSAISHRGRTGALATIVDVSERKNLERRTLILANEVSHRARNLLTLVQALALRKLPSDTAMEFVQILKALARTQDILGKKTVASLRAIIKGELTGFSAQTAISGCTILLTPEAAQDFSLIVHELATNALKYGALSRADGTVAISGDEREDGMFQFVWTEKGGPAIASPPTRAGFGQTVLWEMPKALQAEVTVEYRPSGLRYELIAPASQLSNLTELAGASDH